MSVSHVSSGAIAGTSITIPAHVAGDILLMWAYKDGATSPPTIPAAGGTVPTWNAIDNPTGANINGACLCWALAAGTTDTSGTWTGATGLGISVLRGQHSTPTGVAHGQNGSATATGSLTVVPTMSPSALDGTSQFLIMAGWRTVTAWGTTPTGFTQRAQVATELVIYTKDDTTTWSGMPSIPGTASGNGGYRTQCVEIISAAGAAATARPKIIIPTTAVMRAATR